MITVIVPVHSQFEKAPSLLQALALQVNDLNLPMQFELIMVFNGVSLEEFNAVVEAHKNEKFSFNTKFIYEQATNSSRARNLGARNAEGEILVFADDDEKFVSNWLYKLTTPIVQREAEVCGGRVVPIVKSDLPKWIEVQHWRLFGGLHLSENESCVDFSLGQFPSGGNFAIKKNIFFNAGMFSEDWGFGGKRLKMHEEKELFFRVESKSWKYIPSAISYNLVSSDKIKFSYLFTRAFHTGYSPSKFRLSLSEKLNGCKRYAFELIKSLFLSNSSRLPLSDHARLKLIRFNYYLGKLLSTLLLK